MKRCMLALAAASLILAAGNSAGSFLGFRLLDLDGYLVKWGEPQDGRTVLVKYAFVRRPVAFDDARNCEAMNPVDGLLARSKIDFADFRREVQAAFQMWQSVAQIEFQEVAEARDAGILIGAQSIPEGHAYADVKYRPGSAPARIERSLICLNPQKLWKIGFDGNLRIYDVRYTVAHEIGHAIGLDHPEPHGQLMSMQYEERFRTLQPGDVSGAIQIYGPRAGSIAALKLH